MEHVVFYPGADGAEAFRRAAGLEEAVRLVESLRNDQGIGDVSVFALSPVPLAFRTYVHVELPVGHEAPAEASSEAPAEPPYEPPHEPPSEALVDVPAEAWYEAPAELAFDEPTIPPPPPYGAPELFEAPASFAPEVFAPEVLEAEVFEADVPAPPAPPSDFFEPIEEFQAPEAEAPVEAESFEPESFEPESFEPESFEPEEWDRSEADVAWADSEVWSEAEPVADEVWSEPAPAPDAEVAEPIQESAPIAVPEYHETEEELPPLTLAPGPLLFDGDGAPLASSGSYDLVEEPAAELTDLIPADFTDLIPKDIPHGDLARHTDEPATQVSFEVPAEAPYEEQALQVPVEEPVLEEQAPSTDELPPMDVAEIPSDVSSIEAFEANPIPAAREAVEEEPTPVREGPRGLGFFGG